MYRIMVCGIGTGVGKTVVSGILSLLLDGDYWKPIECGSPSDTATMSTWLHKVHPPAYSLKAGLAPHLAAKSEGITIRPDTIIPPNTSPTLIIEGVGGILVPLTKDCLSIDLFSSWNCHWIIVSRQYLGSINHTLLTIEALKKRNLSLLGIILNGSSDDEITDVPILGRLRPEPCIDIKTLQKYVNEWRPLFSTIRLS